MQFLKCAGELTWHQLCDGLSMVAYILLRTTGRTRSGDTKRRGDDESASRPMNTGDFGFHGCTQSVNIDIFIVKIDEYRAHKCALGLRSAMRCSFPGRWVNKG